MTTDEIKELIAKVAGLGNDKFDEFVKDEMRKR